MVDGIRLWIPSMATSVPFGKCWSFEAIDSSSRLFHRHSAHETDSVSDDVGFGMGGDTVICVGTGGPVCDLLLFGHDEGGGLIYNPAQNLPLLRSMVHNGVGLA